MALTNQPEHMERVPYVSGTHFGAIGASGALLGAAGVGLIPFVVAAVAGGGVCSFSFFGGGLGGGGGSITTGCAREDQLARFSLGGDQIELALPLALITLFFLVSLRGNIGWLLSICELHGVREAQPHRSAPRSLRYYNSPFLDILRDTCCPSRSLLGI